MDGIGNVLYVITHMGRSRFEFSSVLSQTSFFFCHNLKEDN